MIILQGGTRVIIKKIVVKKLYGEYNYEIEFDDNLTFLYGHNGCGKTTILNILSSIITGKLYNLTEFNFQELILSYINNKNHIQSIKIIITDKTTKNMEVYLEDKKYVIEDIDILKERLYRKSEDDSIEESFLELYPFARKIKTIFNYVYLPLNRYGNEIMYTDKDYYRYIYRHHYVIKQNPYSTYLNESLQYISELIRNSCMNINVQENKVNDKFRKDVLSSSIKVSSDMPIAQVFNEIDNCRWEEVLKSKEAYIKTLMDIDVYDKNLKEEIEQFFLEFKKAYDDYQSKSNNEKIGIRVDFAWQYAEFIKIKAIAELAKDNARIKEKIRRPKEMFSEVINDFFGSSGTNKRIQISNDGKVSFDSHGQSIELKDLSSGEKQLIITFASLIFGLKGKARGIFIVDEPEASLHLEWQRKFVSAILKTNKNIQLIFATHSPELISEYSNKAVKLAKK